MVARTLLLKLQEQGWVELPARRMPSPTRSGRAPARCLGMTSETGRCNCGRSRICTLLSAFALHSQTVRSEQLTLKAVAHQLDLALEEDLPWNLWFHCG